MSAPAPLLLFAASGLAREVLALLRTHPTHDVVGLLDDDPALHGTRIDGVPVLGPTDAVVDHPRPDVLVCAGRGAARERIVEKLDAAGVSPLRHATVVHPSVEVPERCEVGQGSVVLAGTVLTADVTVGAHVVVMPHVTLTHDCVVQDFATLCAGVTLGGSVVVGRGAYVGMSASVREHVRVGAAATLGMGAVLLRDQPDGSTWAGVPARPLDVPASAVPAGEHPVTTDRGAAAR
ncbi:acetyltransferase [Cellulomonas sp.]|uniref:acetyltransferase n=1 Tax=Cellulomonas sp. TaxID=40001 RepID=UPI002810CD03|nr:acetyltransferase [Cellulomonas sp.]